MRKAWDWGLQTSGWSTLFPRTAALDPGFTHESDAKAVTAACGTHPIEGYVYKGKATDPFLLKCKTNTTKMLAMVEKVFYVQTLVARCD